MFCLRCVSWNAAGYHTALSHPGLKPMQGRVSFAALPCNRTIASFVDLVVELSVRFVYHIVTSALRCSLRLPENGACNL